MLIAILLIAMDAVLLTVALLKGGEVREIVLRIALVYTLAAAACLVLYVILAGAVNATIGDAQAIGTIIDNDGQITGDPKLAIDDLSVLRQETRHDVAANLAPLASFRPAEN